MLFSYLPFFCYFLRSHAGKCMEEPQSSSSGETVITDGRFLPWGPVHGFSTPCVCLPGAPPSSRATQGEWHIYRTWRTFGTGYLTRQMFRVHRPELSADPSSRLASSKRCLGGGTSTPTSRPSNSTSWSQGRSWTTGMALLAFTSATTPRGWGTCLWAWCHLPRLWSLRSPSSPRWRPKTPNRSIVALNTRRRTATRKPPCATLTHPRCAIRSTHRAMCHGCAQNPSKSYASISPFIVWTTNWCKRYALTTTTTVTHRTLPQDDLTVVHASAFCFTFKPCQCQTLKSLFWTT